MTEYNLNLNVKVEADDIAAAYAAVSVVLAEVKRLGEITKVDLGEPKKTGSYGGHTSGCRQVDSQGRVIRGNTCTCGPVPR